MLLAVDINLVAFFPVFWVSLVGQVFTLFVVWRPLRRRGGDRPWILVCFFRNRGARIAVEDANVMRGSERYHGTDHSVCAP